MVVGTLQSFLQKTVNPETVFQQLDQICGEVQQFIPQDKCDAFVQIYGRYILNAINTANNVVEPAYLCADVLGFCAKSEETPFFTPLLPVMLDNQVRYSVTENDFKKGAVFRYKIFLGEPLCSKPLIPTLSASLSDIIGASVSVDISGQTEMGTLACGAGDNCQVEALEPGINVWYTFEVTIVDTIAPEAPNQFTLTATEFGSSPNIIGEESGWYDEVHPHRHFVPLFPILIAILAMCCCCCACRRRRMHKKQQQQLQHLRELTVDLQAPEQQPQPGYFYYPAQNMVYPYPQQAYIPMVPVSAPPATNENLGHN